jgi:pimeloyl-ACP methyl ester carboxylesterase
VTLPATLTRPTTTARAGFVTLHGASNGERSYVLYEHLAELLPAVGIAIIRYDRRPAAAGDVPLVDQADDALAAAAVLRREFGDVPIALWGYSQGAWAAIMAADREPAAIAALALVSMSAMGPAQQMRFGTAEQLRRHGFAGSDIADLAHLREVYEDYLRGRISRPVAEDAVRQVATRPWFPLAWVPTDLPPPGVWTDMDFDPRPMLDRLSKPVLACYGATDEWVSLEESLAAWQELRDRGRDVTIVQLSQCDHAPLIDGVEAMDHVSVEYVAALQAWCDRMFPV